MAGSEDLNLRVIELDVTDDASVEKAVAEIIERSGLIDVLVTPANGYLLDQFRDDEYGGTATAQIRYGFGAASVTRG